MEGSRGTCVLGFHGRGRTDLSVKSCRSQCLMMSPTAGSAPAYNRRVIPAVCVCQCTVPCQCVQVPDRLRSAKVFTCLPKLPFSAGSPWPLRPGLLPTLTKSQWPGASLVPIKGIGKLPRKKRPERIIQCRPHRSDDNPLIYNTATKEDHYIRW